MNKPSLTADVIKIDVPADFRFLSLIRSCLNALFDIVDDESPHKALAHNVELAVYEVCTNIVQHAYAGINGRILLNFSLDRTGKKITVSTEDTGRSFDLTGSNVQLPEPGSERGYGLFLVHQLVDDVHYRSESGTNVWRLTKRL